MRAYDQYITLNIGFRSAFIYRVHQAGLYSQINMVLNAAAFALIHKKRLLVDTRKFIGTWSDYFGVSLPGGRDAAGWLLDYVPHRYEWLKYRQIGMLLQWASAFDDAEHVIAIPELGFEGGVFAFYRLLANMLCAHKKPKVPMFEGDYVACHIRRGDKLIKEGQRHDVEPYLDLMKQTMPDIKNIFVITDDYSVIEDMQKQAPDYNIHTMCKPGERGYVHEVFLQQSHGQLQRDVTSLQRQVAIACASKMFVGCYLSNLSRFVALSHERPEHCHSIDIQKTWLPGLPAYQK